MRYALLVALSLAACDDAITRSDGTRGPCAAGGQVLGEDGCREVVTIEDACWKLVECGVMPLDDPDSDVDWGGCMFRLEQQLDRDAAEVAVECVALSSCEALIVNDSPVDPYEWPDCLEFR
jgi:hypothetical protein